MTNVGSWTYICCISTQSLRKTGFLGLSEILTRTNGRKHGRLSMFSLRRAKLALDDHGLIHQFELPLTHWNGIWNERVEFMHELHERALQNGMCGRWTVLRLLNERCLLFGFADQRDAVTARLIAAG